MENTFLPVVLCSFEWVKKRSPKQTHGVDISDYEF